MGDEVLGMRSIKGLKGIAMMHVRDGFPMGRSLMDRQPIVGHVGSNLNASHIGQGDC